MKNIILITGCGKGIGREALGYYLNNNKFLIVGIYRSTIDNMNDIGIKNNNLILIKGDASSNYVLESAFENSKSKFGYYPNKFIINAGMRYRSNLEFSKDDSINQLWQINYFSLRTLLVELINLKLTENISLVYVSSIVAKLGFVDLDDYGATKAAAESLIRSMAIRFPKSRFNCVAPGFTTTSYADEFKNRKPDLFQWTLDRTPMGRWANPLEIVKPIDFLLKDNASYITGQTLYVDGGWTANA